jgi:hypothetical protein
VLGLESFSPPQGCFLKAFYKFLLRSRFPGHLSPSNPHQTFSQQIPLQDVLESPVKKVAILAFASAAFLLGSAHAQQMDATFGFNAVHATSASQASSSYSQQSIGGGLTPSVGADFLIRHNFGVGAELSWRASQNQYVIPGTGQTVPFRPFFYDFNGIWLPHLSVTNRVAPELMAGIGGENTRFYVAPSCGSGCQNYATSNHFMGHFGGGLRLYMTHNLFVRPEAHVYLIHNNNEFSSPYATRFGASIGYTLGGR